MHKLLIIDDDENSRDVLKDTLEAEDYEIDTANDGREGIEKIRATLPELVLLDIDMPKMDGIAVLKALKEDPRTQDVPVIMVTAVNADSQVAMSLNLGAVDHIVKPYSSTVVRARVRAALRMAAAKSATETSARRGTVVSFLGAKGGVGTTSVAHNVAVDMTRHGQSVILCELSCDGGTISQELKLSVQETFASLIDDVSGTISPKVLEKYCARQPNGLRIAVSAIAPDQHCPMTEAQATEIVGGLATLADYVVCDLPHLAIPLTAAALRQSDMVILVVGLDPTALHAAEIAYRRLRSLQISPSCIGAVVSIQSVSSVSAISLKDVRETLECPVMGVIPTDPDSFMFAARRGLPLIEVAPNGGAAGALTSLTRRIEERKLVPLQF